MLLCASNNLPEEVELQMFETGFSVNTLELVQKKKDLKINSLPQLLLPHKLIWTFRFQNQSDQLFCLEGGFLLPRYRLYLF